MERGGGGWPAAAPLICVRPACDWAHTGHIAYDTFDSVQFSGDGISGQTSLAARVATFMKFSDLLLVFFTLSWIH